jgi:hypothetical protein
LNRAEQKEILEHAAENIFLSGASQILLGDAMGDAAGDALTHESRYKSKEKGEYQNMYTRKKTTPNCMHAKRKKVE